MLAAYRMAEGDSSKRKEMAEWIVKRCISTSCDAAGGGSDLIYTSESQRKALAAAMRHLWGSETSLFDESLARNDGGPDDCGRMGTASAHEGSRSRTSTEKCYGENGVQGQGNHQDKVELSGTSLVGGDRERIVSGVLQDVRSSQGGGRPDGHDFGVNRGRSAPKEKQNVNETDAERKESLFSDDSAREFSDRCAFGPEVEAEGNGEEEESEDEAKRALSLNLFDAILDKNAIPTMRQNSEY